MKWRNDHTPHASELASNTLYYAVSGRHRNVCVLDVMQVDSKWVDNQGKLDTEDPCHNAKLLEVSNKANLHR